MPNPDFFEFLNKPDNAFLFKKALGWQKAPLEKLPSLYRGSSIGYSGYSGHSGKSGDAGLLTGFSGKGDPENPKNLVVQPLKKRNKSEYVKASTVNLF